MTPWRRSTFRFSLAVLVLAPLSAGLIGPIGDAGWIYFPLLLLCASLAAFVVAFFLSGWITSERPTRRWLIHLFWTVDIFWFLFFLVIALVVADMFLELSLASRRYLVKH